MGDLQGLLDPTEEQLDGPSPLVEICDLLGFGVEIVGEDTQDFAGVSFDAHFTHGVSEGVFAMVRQAHRQEADAV